jgi:hypothetical protein
MALLHHGHKNDNFQVINLFLLKIVKALATALCNKPVLYFSWKSCTMQHKKYNLYSCHVAKGTHSQGCTVLLNVFNTGSCLKYMSLKSLCVRLQE